MTYITKAAHRGVAIAELEVTIEARANLQGMFELDSVRAGLPDVTITMGVQSHADDATRTTRSDHNSDIGRIRLAGQARAMQSLVQRLPLRQP